MRRPGLLLALLALVLGLALVACGEDEDAPAGGVPTVDPTEQEATETGCEPAQEPEPKGEQNLDRPSRRLERGTIYVARVETSCGAFSITLDPRRAPRTGGSFAYLVERGFYDGLTFHRIVPGFVIQGGDPLLSGLGGPGYTVVEEPPQDIAYTRGVVAMAKSAQEPPGASGSQFFVVTGEDAQLPPEYALLGEVTEGIETVERIGSVPTGPDEQPTEPVVIRSITLQESG